MISSQCACANSVRWPTFACFQAWPIGLVGSGLLALLMAGAEVCCWLAVISTGCSFAASLTGMRLVFLAGWARPLVSVRVLTFGISERASSSRRTVATVLSLLWVSFPICRLLVVGAAFSSAAIS